MTKIKHTKKVIDKASDIMTAFYGLNSNNIDNIYRNSNNPFDMIINAFKFGYVQGFKAAKADNNKIGCEV